MLEIKFIFQIKKKKKEVITNFVNIYANNYIQERRENIGNILINKERLKGLVKFKFYWQ